LPGKLPGFREEGSILSACAVPYRAGKKHLRIIFLILPKKIKICDNGKQALAENFTKNLS